MPVPTEDTGLIADAYAYVLELYRELSDENGAPLPGTENQAVTFILTAPELCAAVRTWAAEARPDEASTAPPRRLRRDPLYERTRAFLAAIMDKPRLVGAS